MTEFPMDAQSVAAARRFVGQAIGHCDPDTVDVARLLTSELATNALVHARSAFEVIASEYDGTVHVEVRDACASPPMPVSVKPTDEHGRGIQLLRALSTEWGVVDNPAGKTVWFDLRCQGNEC
jgi:anti-sigma regulatory factor (Ser/Thr protein kinase)